MDFYQLIETRESVRAYDPEKKVPSETLRRILNAGRMAPSAGNRQPWEFLLISTPETLRAARSSYQREWFHKAPHILAVKGDKSRSWVRPKDGYNSIETDLAIAMDHMTLAAASEGVGSCWIIAFDPDILFSALGLKENEIIYAITPFGYPPEGYQRKEKIRKEEDEVIKYL
jgi:nitroreductase